MSFGGAVGAMITSLKNNKRERPSAFKNLKNCNGIHRKLEFNKTASKQQLQEIKEKLQKENKKTAFRNSILFSAFIILLIYFVGFYKF